MSLWQRLLNLWRLSAWDITQTIQPPTIEYFAAKPEKKLATIIDLSHVDPFKE